MGGWPDAGGGRNCRSYRCIRLSQFAAVTKLEPVSIVVGGLIFAFGEGQVPAHAGGYYLWRWHVHWRCEISWHGSFHSCHTEKVTMANEVEVHPVYRAINKPLTVWGAERRLSFWH